MEKKLDAAREVIIPRHWEPDQIRTAIANLKAWGHEDLLDMLGLAIDIPDQPFQLNLDMGESAARLRENRRVAQRRYTRRKETSEQAT